jgi:hypothetical protein
MESSFTSWRSPAGWRVYALLVAFEVVHLRPPSSLALTLGRTPGPTVSQIVTAAQRLGLDSVGTAEIIVQRGG